MGRVTKEITAENTFTDGVRTHNVSDGSPDAAVSISGTFVATVTVQRSLDDGVTWVDLAPTYTAPTEVNAIKINGIVYRVGVKTGDFTSGTVSVGIVT